jgi:hypothetical protein
MLRRRVCRPARSPRHFFVLFRIYNYVKCGERLLLSLSSTMSNKPRSPYLRTRMRASAWSDPGPGLATPFPPFFERTTPLPQNRKRSLPLSSVLTAPIKRSRKSSPPVDFDGEAADNPQAGEGESHPLTNLSDIEEEMNVRYSSKTPTHPSLS